MTVEVTVWITPFTNLPSRQAAVDRAKAIADTVSSVDGAQTHPNVLLPTHYGVWPQSQCNQSLPADLLVASPSDIGPIRADIESQGVGFGAWGVPHELAHSGVSTARVAAEYAVESGYYAANFERGVFWTPGSDPAKINQWWTEFWGAIDQAGSTAALDGSVSVTLVPSYWEMGYYTDGGLFALVDGANAICVECYGGPSTPEYPPSATPPAFDLWPGHCFPALQNRLDALPRNGSQLAPLVPVLALANVAAQARQAVDLNGSQLQVWAI